MKKFLLIASFAMLSLAAICVYQLHLYNDGKLHVIFCDVGQGDGILIRTPSKKFILVDAGPDKRILDCLSRHMPLWTRTIDLALLSHPHADHFMGYYYVAERYNITQFASEDLKNTTAAFGGLINLLTEKKIASRAVSAQDRWKFTDGVVLTVAGPTKEFLQLTDPDGIIDSSAESASLVLTLAYGKAELMLTGDAPLDQMHEVVDRRNASISVLQIPHHGSSTGLDTHVLDVLRPKVAVISVGKNSYGHPTKYTLDLLREVGSKILRTDQMGDVELISDGSHWRY